MAKSNILKIVFALIKIGKIMFGGHDALRMESVMNITQYSASDSRTAIYNGYMSLKQEYAVASADEYLYKYIGKNSAYPITASIHNDDLPEFYKAIEKLDEQPQHLILRLKDSHDKYRYMYWIMRYNGRMLGTFRSIDVKFIDIMGISEKFYKITDNIVKYRKLMSLSDCLYFEYDYGKRLVTIFEYNNDRSVTRFKKDIDDMVEDISSDETYTSKQRTEFGALYDYLNNAADNIDITVDGGIFHMNGKMLQLRGGIMYKDDCKDKVTGLLNILDDNGEKAEQKYYMTDNAIDPGTSVLNKRAISELAMDLITGASSKEMYVIMLDIDDFKNINDTYGHMFGDEVLAKFAEVLKSVIGSRGYVGRFGGDEFFVILDNVRGTENLRRILKTISKHLAWAYKGDVGDFELTTSIGVAKYPDNGKSYEELLCTADKCLYIAKAKGKARFIIYDEKLHGTVNESDDTDRFIGSRMMVDNSQRAAAVSRMIIDMNSRGKAAVVPSFEKIREYFDIDGITMYTGAGYQRNITVGKYIGEIEKADFINSVEFQHLFDDNGMYSENKVLRLREISEEAYKLLDKQETKEFILVKESNDDCPDKNTAISFDIFNRSRKWSETEENFLLILAKSIISVINLEQ